MNINRLAERARTARDELDEILDAGWVGTLSVSVDGSPQVVPILYARVGDAVILHGSTGAGSLRAAMVMAGEIAGRRLGGLAARRSPIAAE